MKWVSLLFLILSFPFLARALTADSFGYVSDVQQERYTLFREVDLAPPKLYPELSLRDSIWTPSVAKEVREQYRDRFGQLDTAAMDRHAGPFQSLQANTANLQALEADNLKRREFAEFTVKRLSEYHFDNYMKTEPKMRPIYEAKEKLSNIQVQVSEEARLQAKYSFAGNILDLILHNPLLECRVAVEMDSHAFGPTTPIENRLWLGKELTKTLKILSQTTQTDGITTLEFIQTIHRWTRSIGYSTFINQTGSSPRENRLSLGFGHAF